MLNLAVLSSEVQEYLALHAQTNITRFILNGSPFDSVTVQELAQQLEGKQKAKDKLPSWYGKQGVFFPPKLNLEQTSSEITAKYKAQLVNGHSLADITGGLGVDTFYFSKKVEEVDYFEKNEVLAEIARHNFSVLNTHNVQSQTGDGLQLLLTNKKKYGTIYIDPSRRDDVKGKVFMLKDCTPDVSQNLDGLFQLAETILVKTSPILDISAALHELKHVSAIHIVAVKNEVKELLWILKKGSKDQDIQLNAVNIISDKKQEFLKTDYAMAFDKEATYALPKKYLYEPNAALMKSGLFNFISDHFKVDKLHSNTQLYTSEELVEFDGRRFSIQESFPFSKKEVLKRLKGKKANVTVRNFKESVSALKKKFDIKDGGNLYVFFTTTMDNKTCVIICQKISNNDSLLT